jgi:hypothetical protein
MKFAKLIDDVAVYMSGAINRLFELNDDHYPATGVQPYSGDAKSTDRKHRRDW